MARVLASGGRGPSRASMIGEALGTGFSAGAIPAIQQEQELAQLTEQFNPIREALMQSIGSGGAATPGQLLLQQITADPRQFARFMQNPQNIQSAAAAASLGAEPESKFPTLDEINATLDRARAFREAGENRRADILEARVRDLAGIEEIRPNHNLVQRVLPDNQLQTLWADNERRSFFDMAGNPVQLGPNDRVLESASLSGAIGDVLPESEAIKITDMQTTAENFVATVNDALTLLQNNPDVATMTGNVSAFINDMQQEGIALARNMGMEFDPEIMEPETHASTFDRLGIENRQWRGLINSLAFRAAAAEAQQAGRAASNADVERFITIIGGAGADPRAIARNLTDVAGRVVRDFQTKYRNTLQQEFEGELGLERLPIIEGTQDRVEVPDAFQSAEEVDAASLDQLDQFINGLSEGQWQALPADVQERISARILAGE